MSGTESQPHHHPGLLDKVKGIYHQRPSSRDRNGFGEDRHSSRDNPALSPSECVDTEAVDQERFRRKEVIWAADVAPPSRFQVSSSSDS